MERHGFLGRSSHLGPRPSTHGSRREAENYFLLVYFIFIIGYLVQLHAPCRVLVWVRHALPTSNTVSLLHSMRHLKHPCAGDMEMTSLHRRHNFG